jgi:Lon-like ATP-dependent protease
MESVIESKGEKGKGSLHQTGQMGDVMKESSMIAYTYSRGFLTQNMPKDDFFDRTTIHLHVPEGATPKDGPSAGVTMTTSLLSLALGKKVKEGIAMTGEMTLTGKVLKIGGVKEKLIAAKRSKIHTVILPHDNQSDYEELPEAVKEGLKVHFVQWYPEIYNLVFDQ